MMVAMSVQSGRSSAGHERADLKFDSSYFEALNAANHRPVANANLSSAGSASSEDTSFWMEPISVKSAPAKHPTMDNMDKKSKSNILYYSPETYGKASIKNHQVRAFCFPSVYLSI